MGNKPWVFYTDILGKIAWRFYRYFEQSSFFYAECLSFSCIDIQLLCCYGTFSFSLISSLLSKEFTFYFYLKNLVRSVNNCGLHVNLNVQFLKCHRNDLKEVFGVWGFLKVYIGFRRKNKTILSIVRENDISM